MYKTFQRKEVWEKSIYIYNNPLGLSDYMLFYSSYYFKFDGTLLGQRYVQWIIITEYYLKQFNKYYVMVQNWIEYNFYNIVIHIK